MFERKQASLEYAINLAISKTTENIERNNRTEWTELDNFFLIWIVRDVVNNINFTVYCNERIQPNEGWFY
tara:strand:- start:384 stop:593 length:210 start_codon:yes stop_codon:yes gene_type:complete